MDSTAPRNQSLAEQQIDPVLRQFDFQNLAGARHQIAKRFFDLAHTMNREFPKNWQLLAGLRQLLEARGDVLEMMEPHAV